MSPKEVLQIAGSELDRLSDQLIGGDWGPTEPGGTIEALTGKLVLLRKDLGSLEGPELSESLRGILAKAKRVQTLLEAGTTFHCCSIFGRAEAPDTYKCDGTFGADHGSRMIFQG